MTDTYKDYVLLPLRAGEAEKYNSTHGAYASNDLKMTKQIDDPDYWVMGDSKVNISKIVSMRQVKFLRKYRKFLDIAFGEGEKK